MRRATILAAAVSLLPAFPVFAEPGNLPEDTLARIVDTYAGNFYRKGEAGGLSVAITLNGQVFHKSYGYRSHGNQTVENAIDEHSIFEIGSVTKIWTTALVGQAVATGGLPNPPPEYNTTPVRHSAPVAHTQAPRKHAPHRQPPGFPGGLLGDKKP